MSSVASNRSVLIPLVVLFDIFTYEKKLSSLVVSYKKCLEAVPTAVVPAPNKIMEGIDVKVLGRKPAL